MIGFENELAKKKPHSDEGPETSGLDKRELYEAVSLRWFIPPFDSRGICREYLLAVYHGQVFRVTHSDIRHFEVDLENKMIKRIGILNNGLLVRKLNRLLDSRGDRPLGFREEEPPEQVSYCHKDWLYRAARFIDPTNLMEFFEAAVRKEPPLTSQSSNISRVYFGRVKASKYFFRKPETRNNRKFWDGLRTISDTYRGYLSQVLAVEVLKNDLREGERRAAEIGRTLDDLISKSAFSYTLISNPNSAPDVILKDMDKASSEIRKEVSMNCRM